MEWIQAFAASIAAAAIVLAGFRWVSSPLERFALKHSRISYASQIFQLDRSYQKYVSRSLAMLAIIPASMCLLLLSGYFPFTAPPVIAAFIIGIRRRKRAACCVQAIGVDNNYRDKHLAVIRRWAKRDAAGMVSLTERTAEEGALSEPRPLRPDEIDIEHEE